MGPGARVRVRRRPAWLTPATGSIGLASFLSDVGHEVPTSLLPSFLTGTLGAPAAALGLIEGIADGAAGVAKLAGGALADDSHRRRTVAVGGYTATAMLSSAIGLATTPVQVAILRTGAWAARGLRGPARNALLADVVEPKAYGRAYGFERAMDNFGAIVGPLFALLLVSLVGLRTAIVLSIIPGLAAALAIAYAARHVKRSLTPEHRPIRLQVRRVIRGTLGRLFIGMGAFEIGNAAATLLILRAIELLSASRGERSAAQIALVLYIGYNIAATLASLPGGHLTDRRSAIHSLVVGATALLGAYALFAGSGGIGALLVAFVLAGVGIGFVETAEAAAVAAFAPESIRGSAFGLLAAMQSLGNFAASAVAGVLWTAVSPTAAFLWLAVWMVIALVALVITRPAAHGQRGPTEL
jgi:MFS family permease